MIYAELFDGSRAEQIRGSLRFLPDQKIEFSPLEQEQGGPYRWSGILGVERRGDLIELRLTPVKSNLPEAIIRFTGDEKVFREMESLVKRRGLEKGFHHVSRLPLIILLFLIPAIGSIVIGGYFYFVHNLHRVIPENLDTRLGKMAEAQITASYKVCEDPDLNRVLEKMVRDLTMKEDRFAYRVVILDSPGINAFAFPGGDIYFLGDLIASSSSPEEVAGVLAHEMAHVERRHGIQNVVRGLGYYYFTSLIIGAGFEGLEGVDLAETLSEVGGSLFLLKYSRDFEMEADAMGMERLQKSGYPVDGIVSFLERVKGQSVGGNYIPDWMKTHPGEDQRIDLLKEKTAKMEKAGSPIRLPSGIRWDRIKAGCQSN